jgi:hypothetical protein
MRARFNTMPALTNIIRYTNPGGSAKFHRFRTPAETFELDMKRAAVPGPPYIRSKY